MSQTRSRVTTHVLDAALGRPAQGVPVRLEQRVGDSWSAIAHGSTDSDGRVTEFGPADLHSGVYRVSFDTATYFVATGQVGFYPDVMITFTLADPEAHYHIPLLLSPYAFTTYRGS
jgi:5-hydroxyisourate hydrolase